MTRRFGARCVPILSLGVVALCACPPAHFCQAGKQSSCTCEDGRRGAQTCDDDGARWLPCRCTDLSQDAGAMGVDAASSDGASDVDVETAPDAARAPDAATSGDAGVEPDAASDNDAAQPADAALSADAAAGSDAAVGGDAARGADASAGLDAGLGVDAASSEDGGAFSFAVFGDLNGGGCAKNDRAHRLIAQVAASSADFYLQTGDLIEGTGTASCFASEPDGTSCVGAAQSGNMAQQFAPLMSKPPLPGMRASFFPVIGNHDAGWGSGWYPDPCGQGICSFLGMTTSELRQTYLTKPDTLSAPGLHAHVLNHGDVCSLTQDDSAHSVDFYYAFTHANSKFIVLRQHEDYYGMLNCNGGHSGYDSCAAYCSDPSLFLDTARNNNCYAVAQYDWLVNELRQASGVYQHVFVFGHAPLLGSGDSHGPTAGASQIRALLEQYGVDAYINGHNHAYERSYRVRGTQVDATGTAYITVGVGGAFTDGNSGDWYTAASYRDWASYNEYEKVTTYLLMVVDGSSVRGEVHSLASGLVDSFAL